MIKSIKLYSRYKLLMIQVKKEILNINIKKIQKALEILIKHKKNLLICSNNNNKRLFLKILKNNLIIINQAQKVIHLKEINLELFNNIGRHSK